MDDLISTLKQAALGIWRRRWIAMAVAWPLAILMGVVVAKMSDKYEATTRIFVDTQTVLKPLMKDLAYQPDIDQQVSMLAKTLISRPNIQLLMSQPQVGMSQITGVEKDLEIDRLMKAIKVEPSVNNMYAISYKDADPRRAQQLVKSLVEMFVDAGVGEKRRDSEDARRFINEQIRTYEAKLGEAEERLKDFKLRNFGMTGTSNQDYFSRVSNLSDVVAKLRVDLSAAEQGRDALKRELAAEDPQLPPDTSGPGAAPSETDTRMDTQRKLLDDLLRRYTDDHPDVIATRRTIAQLERQKRQEMEAAARGGRGRGNAATSPVYQKIRISLAEAEANVASLRTQLSVQSGRLEETRGKAGKVPEAEAELAQLNRDYDVLRKNYDTLVARRESASLGVKLDQSAQLADFRIVEPPRVSGQPAMPSRLLLAAVAPVVALLIGALTAYGLMMLAPAVHDGASLTALTGRPVLGSVSMFVSDSAKQLEKRNLQAFMATGAAFFVLSAVWVVWVAKHAAS